MRAGNRQAAAVKRRKEKPPDREADRARASIESVFSCGVASPTERLVIGLIKKRTPSFRRTAETALTAGLIILIHQPFNPQHSSTLYSRRYVAILSVYQTP